MKPKPKHGGARKGAGRPAPDGKMKMISMRLSRKHIARLKELGSVKWLRSLLD